MVKNPAKATLSRGGYSPCYGANTEGRFIQVGKGWGNNQEKSAMGTVGAIGVPGWRGRLAAALACLALAACAVDHYDPRPLSPRAIADDYAARSLSSPELHRFVQQHQPPSGEAWPPATWNVAALTLAAFYFNPDLDAARARLATAEAGAITAAQRPNPTLQLPLQRTLNPKDGESPWTLGMALDIPIETAGRRGYRIDGARRLASAARFQVAETAWGVRSRLRAALLSLWSAGARAELLRQQMALDQDMVAMLERRLAVGDVSPWEASQQRLILMQSQADLLAAQRQASAARANVATALGVSAQALDGVDLDLASFGRPPAELPPRSLQLQALLNRADVGAALARYEASQAALQLELARQYPNINLGPGYTLDQGARRPGFSFAVLELPIFNRNEGPIAEARGRRQEAEARLKQVEAQALGDTDAAVTAYQSSRDLVRRSEAQLDEQERQLARTRKALAIGQADRMAVALAERSRLAADLALQDARFQMQQAVGRIEDATQRPLAVSAAGRPGDE